MGSYTNYFIFLILSFLTLNTIHICGMKKSPTMNFATYSKPVSKTNGINLLDVWIASALEMVDTELKKWSSDKENNNSSEFASADAHAFVHNDLKDHRDYGLLNQVIASCWEKGLNNKYQVGAVEFIEMVNVRYQIDEEYLELLKQQDCYTLEPLLQIIVDIVLKDFDLEIGAVKFITITKQIIVTYILQNFLNDDEQLSWCNCSHVTIAERVVMLIMSLEKLFQNFNPEKCTRENPLVYTSFGSGALLYDYIVISLLINFGYNYFDLNFIDAFYDQNKFPDYKKWTEKPWVYQLGLLNGDFNFQFFKDIEAYLGSSPNTNHMLAAIDTTHHGNARSQFKQLIKKTSDIKTVVGLLADHEIRYNFKAQLKLLV